MDSRLTSKDYKLFLVCLGIALASVFVIAKYFYQAFPEASIQFKVTRSQSRVIAEQVLQVQDLNVKEYRHSAIFAYDDDAKTFLEKELGAEQANRIMGKRVRLWRWSNRWFKPMTKEEVTVHISPAGELIGLIHKVPEEAPGAGLASDSARFLARRFLTTQVNLSADSLEFVETTIQQRPNRIDHTFTWKDKNWSVLEAEYRYQITVQGDQIGAYSEYLHIPDKWQRDYEKQRSKNDTTSYVAAFFLLLTILAMLATMIRYTRHQDIKWKTALIYGLAAAVLTLLSQLNSMPLEKFYYATTESFNGFISRQLLLGLVYALLAGLGIFFLTAAAEPLYRERYRQTLSLSKIFSWQGIRSKQFFIAVIVGLTMTFAFAGYQVVFYLVAEKLGGWTPQDIPYSNMLNTVFPWIFVLLAGFIPAVSEEFISRLFSIPFLEKYLKSRWLAVVIPAFIWGFAHSNYAQQPFYIRGIEVGCAGVVIGFLLLRFGIVAPLIWHYTIDAFYTAMVLFRSGNSWFIITGAVSCGLLLLPLFIALGAYIKTGRFAPQDSLTNGAEGVSRVTEPLPGVDELPAYKPLSKRRLLAGLVIGVLLLAVLTVKTERFGDFVKYPVSKEKVRAAADNFIRSRGVEPDSFQSVIYSTDKFDPLAAKYVVQHSTIARLNRLYDKEIKAHRRAVRYFKPLQKQEYLLHIDPQTLVVLGFARVIDDDAPGAEMAQDSAQALAVVFAQQRGMDVTRLVLKEVSSERKKNRLDYTFIWESADDDSLTIGEMKQRVMIELQGDVVSRYSINPKLPEAWQRDRGKRTLVNTLHLALRLLVVLTLAGLAVIRFIRIARVGKICWKKSLFIAGVVSFLFLIDALLQFKLTLINYETSVSMNLFTISVMVAILISVLGLFIGLGLCLSMISALYPSSLQTLQTIPRKLFARDALAVSLIALAGFAGITGICDLLTVKFSTAALFSAISVPDAIDSPVPLFSILVQLIYLSLFIAVLAGTLAFILKDTLKRPALMLLFGILALISIVPLEVRTLPEAALAGGQALLFAAAIFIFIKYLARNNYLAYLLAPLWVMGMREGLLLLRQGNGMLTMQGIGLFLILALFTVWLLPGLAGKKHHNELPIDNVDKNH